MSQFSVSFDWDVLASVYEGCVTLDKDVDFSL